MAYSTDNPPRIIAQSVGTNGGGLWVYVSTDDLATVNTANYFTNGRALGMRAGDAVIVIDTDSNGIGLAAVNADTAGAVDITDGAGNTADTD